MHRLKRQAALLKHLPCPLRNFFQGDSLLLLFGFRLFKRRSLCLRFSLVYSSYNIPSKDASPIKLRVVRIDPACKLT